MNDITVFEKGLYAEDITVRPITSVLEEISNGKYHLDVEGVRACIKAGDKTRAGELKKRLPAFTPSGVFINGRRSKNLNNYSGIIILDIDNLGTRLDDCKEIAAKSEFTYSCFISPSGNGLKILVRVDSTAEMHKMAFLKVVAFYESLLNLKVDPSGKDVSRLCFYSSDPEIYINEESTVFEVKLQESENHYLNLFVDTVEYTKNKVQFQEGSRNNFVHLLANNCNRLGIPESETYKLIKQDFNYDENEVTSTIKSAYSNTHEHGAIPIDTEASDEGDMFSTPTIPSELYDHLPELLRQGVTVFDTEREKDLFLTGALTVLSGCMDSVTGYYDQRPIHANLYAFVIAPAASGKGAMAQAKLLGMNIHQQLLMSSNARMEEYKTKLKLYKRSSRRENVESPEKPKFKILYFPANTSSSAVISHLDQSDSKGIIFETEADTMGNSFKQDWGGYSDLLRKAFHHEPITYSRKSNDEFIEVQRPRLSIALSGTPSQVSNLIHSSEDGLFSRFIFYTFRVKSEWRNVDPREEMNFDQTFKNLAGEVELLYKALLTKKVNFQLSEDQWKILNATFAGWLQEVVTFVGEDAASTVKRLGVVVFRIAMILTILRKYENGDLNENVICDDVDFHAALHLASVYKEHAFIVFSTLQGNKGSSISQAVRQFFDSLPGDREFSRQEAVSLGNKLGLKERTVGKYLKKLLDGYLTKSLRFGQYQKIA